MINWILIHTSGLLDWLAVITAVFVMVFLIQFMANFYKDPDDQKDSDEDCY